MSGLYGPSVSQSVFQRDKLKIVKLQPPPPNPQALLLHSSVQCGELPEVGFNCQILIVLDYT